MFKCSCPHCGETRILVEPKKDSIEGCRDCGKSFTGVPDTPLNRILYEIQS